MGSGADPPVSRTPVNARGAGDLRPVEVVGQRMNTSKRALLALTLAGAALSAAAGSAHAVDDQQAAELSKSAVPDVSKAGGPVGQVGAGAALTMAGLLGGMPVGPDSIGKLADGATKAKG
ncbi:hypothetical protein GCM10010495_35180 [Kitasatospora herbaricolor]|nr:hypothetical protein GCM10010495_35180 [Kitasatospora herbaricolor]